MSDAIKIAMFLPIPPKPQTRPRVTTKGKMPHAYKTKQQKLDDEEMDNALFKYKPEKPIDGPIHIEIIACMPIPKYLSKTIESKKNDDSIDCFYHIVKPDLDNIIKFLLDRMSCVGFWNDDSQIAKIKAAKIYSGTPGYVIVLDRF